MQLRFLGPVPVVLVTVFFAITGARSSYRAERAVIHDAEEASLASVATVVRHATDTEARRATALAEMLAVRASIQSHVSLAERDALREELLGIYERLKSSYGVEGIQFSVPPGQVFLRMHQPEKFGDDVTGRQMVMLAMNGGESQAGVEVGNSGAKVRGVVQVRAAGAPLGVVEVMVGYEPVLQSVKEVTGFEVAAYVEQIGDPPRDARMVGGYREIATTDRETVSSVIDAATMDRVNDTLLTREVVEGTRFGVLRMPLVDFGGDTIGVIVATRTFETYQRAENAALRKAVVAAVLEIVFITGAVLLVFNGLLMRPVRRLTARLASGEGPDAELVARKDEVGELARAVTRAVGEKS